MIEGHVKISALFSFIRSIPKSICQIARFKHCFSPIKQHYARAGITKCHISIDICQLLNCNFTHPICCETYKTEGFPIRNPPVFILRTNPGLSGICFRFLSIIGSGGSFAPPWPDFHNEWTVSTSTAPATTAVSVSDAGDWSTIPATPGSSLTIAQSGDVNHS